MCGYIEFLGHQLRVVSKGSVGWSGQSAQTSVIMNTQKNDTEAMTQVVRLNNHAAFLDLSDNLEQIQCTDLGEHRILFA